MDLTSLDLSNSCRTCLSMTNCTKFLNSIHVSQEEKTFYEMINFCSSVKVYFYFTFGTFPLFRNKLIIQIVDNENLPKKICDLCITQLITAYLFKQKCEQSEILLQDYIKEKMVNEIFVDSDGFNKEEELEDDNFSNNDTIVDDVTLEDDNENKKLHPCTICNKKYRKYNLSAHMKTHKDCRPFTCSVCKRHFRRSDVLTRHSRTHINDKLHLCGCCSKGFEDEETLKVHLKDHNEKKNKKLFVCTICKKQYTQNTGLQIHMRIHTGKLYSLKKIKITFFHFR